MTAATTGEDAATTTTGRERLNKKVNLWVAVATVGASARELVGVVKARVRSVLRRRQEERQEGWRESDGYL